MNGQILIIQFVIMIFLHHSSYTLQLNVSDKSFLNIIQTRGFKI